MLTSFDTNKTQILWPRAFTGLERIRFQVYTSWKSFKGKVVTWYHERFAGVSNIMDQPGIRPIVQSIGPLIAIILNIKGLVASIFKNPGKEIESIAKNSSNVLKHLSIFGLFQVPISIYVFSKRLVDVRKAINSGRRELMINTALLAASAFQDIVTMPAKIAQVVNIYVLVPSLALWGNALGAAALFLSTTSMILTGLSHKSTRCIAQAWVEKSCRAFLEQLEKKLDNAEGNALANAFSPLDKTKLKDEVDKTLQLLGKADNQEQLKKIMTSLSERIAGIDPGILAELKDVGNKAYIECVKNADADVLKKHFMVKGESLKVALNAIEDSAKERNRIVSNLKLRLGDKLLSDKHALAVQAIGLLASVILMISSFAPAASPIAPVGMALIIGLSTFAIAEAIVKYKRRKQFEEAMGIR